jgi:hypothetical protein
MQRVRTAVDRSGVFATFATDLRRAEGLAIVDAISKVTAAADREWRAAAWWLERTYPDRYSSRRTVRTEVTAADGPITLAGLEALMGID